MNRSDLKLLLIQIRQNTDVKKEEVSSFAKFGNIKIEQIDVFDVFTNEPIPESLLIEYHGILIGGASEASVLEPKRYPFVPNIKEAINTCIRLNISVFASCFGFQVAVLALGGEIIRDKTDFEMGTIPIKLTEAAKHDPCFKNVVTPFIAVSVHQEKAIELPNKCIKLAYTQKCIHAFKLIDKPFWAFQFHPELDDICLKERLSVYKEKYTEDSSHFQKIIEDITPTPDSNALVANFVNTLLK